VIKVIMTPPELPIGCSAFRDCKDCFISLFAAMIRLGLSIRLNFLLSTPTFLPESTRSKVSHAGCYTHNLRSTLRSTLPTPFSSTFATAFHIPISAFKFDYLS